MDKNYHAYPLNYAMAKLEENGYEVVLKHTQPPEGQPPSVESGRVIRQRYLGNNLVELLVSLNPW